MPKVDVQVPEEFKLLADSIGFGGGFKRTYRMFAVYVIDKDGKISLRGTNTDRFFKTRSRAEKEAERINFMNLMKWNGSGYVPVENPYCAAFVKEIEVTERTV